MKGRAALAGLIALLVAGPADAFVAYVWTRTSLQFTNLGRAEASVTATGLATLASSSSTSSHLESIRLTGQSLQTGVPVTDPFAAPITSAVFSIRQRPDLQGNGLIGNVSGAIASSTGGFMPNTVPMTGGVTLCLLAGFLPCMAQLNLPFGATSAGAQVGGGVGGILTIGGTGTIRVSVLGASYTAKTVSAANRTANGGFDVFVEQGFAHGPASNTSSTAQISGVLQIVTASRMTSVGPGAVDVAGAISRTLIHVVPEPQLALLFAAGAALMGWLGRRRPF